MPDEQHAAELRDLIAEQSRDDQTDRLPAEHRTVRVCDMSFGAGRTGHDAGMDRIDEFAASETEPDRQVLFAELASRWLGKPVAADALFGLVGSGCIWTARHVGYHPKRDPVCPACGGRAWRKGQWRTGACLVCSAGAEDPKRWPNRVLPGETRTGGTSRSKARKASQAAAGPLKGGCRGKW